MIANADRAPDLRATRAGYRERLAPAARQLLKGADTASAEVQAFVERALVWCEQASLDPRDFNLLQAQVLGQLMPRLMPGARAGLIPAVTRHGRHRRIDDYVLGTPWRVNGRGGVFADIGCGFPPLTSIDSAERLGAAWRVVATDPQLHAFLLTDADGSYACLDASGDVIYFQPGSTEIERWQAMLDDGAATRERFRGLAARLREVLDQVPATGPAAVESDGVRLERNPLDRFKRSNLRFERAGILDFAVGAADVVRCFNVLVYFDAAFRARALTNVASQLKPGGLFLCGVDWTDTSAARYTVYRNENGAMVEKEFAFSIDLVRPVSPIPLILFHEHDHEATRHTQALAVLRADADCRRAFDADLDTILAEIDLCTRQPDGFLGPVPEGITGEALEQRLAAVESRLRAQGWVREAVNTLRRHGVDA